MDNHYMVVVDNNCFNYTKVNPCMVVVLIATSQSKPLNLTFSYTSITERRQ